MFFESKPLSVKEAAILSGVTEKIIRHEMSARIVRPKRTASRRVTLGPRAVFYFSLISRLPVELTKTDRKDLFDLITDRMRVKGRWKREPDRLVLDGPVPVELPTSELTRSVADRVRLFASGKRRVVSNPDVLSGEPIFEGTRVSVRHVGELAKKGVPLETLREDFPRLTDRDIEFARLYVALGRPPGRPRKLRLLRK